MLENSIRLLCTGIDKINELSSGTEVLEVRFKDYSPCLIYGSKSEFIECLGKYVEVTFRWEIVKGERRQVVNNMTVLSQVNVLSQDNDFKLFLQDVPRNKCTVIFSKLENNSSLPKAVMYCTNIELNSNNRATWATLTVMDAEYKLSKLRLFHPEDYVTSFVGNYIQADIDINSFGLKTTEIVLRDDLGGTVNPLIDISIQYIKNTFQDDSPSLKCLEESKLLESMSKYNPTGEYMMGYELIRLAKELSIAQTLSNLTKDIDKKLLLRVLLFKRLYILTEDSDDSTSIELKNVLILSAYPNLACDAKLVNAIHGCRTQMAEVDLIQPIADMVKVIVDSEMSYKYKRRELGVNI